MTIALTLWGITFITLIIIAVNTHPKKINHPVVLKSDVPVTPLYNYPGVKLTIYLSDRTIHTVTFYKLLSIPKGVFITAKEAALMELENDERDLLKISDKVYISKSQICSFEIEDLEPENKE